ncbi:MAG: polysaccharide deacetylase family protein [Candidatus Eremiobacteraeota bacterium]|nr:polysaccharide deacetylase family protein [Candidatus Eremiobacteraeota bacterium]
MKSPGVFLVLTLLGLLGLRGWSKPLPTVLPPGAEQPVAPGYKDASALPTLEWNRSPAIHRVEYGSNGFIEVAHALILVPKEATVAKQLAFSLEAVKGAFARREKLHEVDVSVYAAETFDGFGGPPPLLTASVPKSRLREFASLGVDFERLWLSDNPAQFLPFPRPPISRRERWPVFEGEEGELQAQRRHQAASRPERATGLYFHGPSDRREAALTFDDSPHPLYEPLLLDSLRRAGVRATFFCIGRNSRVYPYFIRDMLQDGHELGNHTYHHVRLPGLKNDQVIQEILLTNQVLESILAMPVRLFRPPGGDYSNQTLQCARETGMTTVFWTDDPGDFDNPGDSVIEERLLENLRPGGIVLLHDNVEETLQVLPTFVRLAEREGYRLLPVGQMIEEDR